MTRPKDWRESVLRLHAAGWGTDEIHEAAEVLAEACREGEFIGIEIRGLSAAHVRQLLGTRLDENVRHALLHVADLLEQQTEVSDALREALFDLDAFAYKMSCES